MLGIRFRSLNFADYCLVAYLLMALVFVRAKVGFVSAYTLLPLWMACTWGASLPQLMRERQVIRVVWTFAIFVAVFVLQRIVYQFDLDLTVLTLKNYVAAFFGWFIFAYYYHMRQEDKIRLFALITLAVVVVNAFWNFSIEGTVAFASRAATGGALEMQMSKGGGVDWDLADALSSGVVTFYGMVATALLIPASLYVAALSGRYGLLFLFTAGVSLLAVLRASYMLSLIYISVGIYLLIASLMRVTSIRWVWRITLVAVLALFSTMLLVSDPIIIFLESFSKRKENEIYATKLQDIQTAIQTGDMSYVPRIQNYLISFNTIRRRPLFGAGFDANHTHTGGHSEILDMVAQVGLLGFLPYIMLFAVTEKYFRITLDRRSRHVRNLRYIFWAPLLLASFTNPTKGFDIWFAYFFTVPAMAFWLKPQYRDVRLLQTGVPIDPGQNWHRQA